MKFDQSIGRTASRGEVIVIVEIENVRNPGVWPTVTHGEISDPLNLSIMGEVWEPGDRRRHDASRCGQVTDSLLEIVKPAEGWTLEEVRELHDIWERWHLNTMVAACAHQEVVYEDSAYGRRPSLDKTPACPETGYRYGSKWLTDPLPTDVIARIEHLMRERA
jgi:hypothetical protein